MSDAQKEKSEPVEKNSLPETVTPQESEENKHKKEPIPESDSDEEKLEKLHFSDSAQSSEEPTTVAKTTVAKTDRTYKEKTNKNPAATDETKGQSRENPITNERKLEDDNETETSSAETIQETQQISSSVASCTKEPREKIIRNQSDIFSLKEVPTTLQTSIFSVNGCPSRKVFRKQEPAGHLFQKSDDPPADKVDPNKANRITKENYNDEKRPSSSYRNPLTGSGLSSNDEYKSKGIKRKDGNPLLGLGYDAEVTSVTSQHRIPPGGYSHKLW